MRRFEDLTQLELAVLSEEDLNLQIEVEAMAAGIEKPGPAPEIVVFTLEQMDCKKIVLLTIDGLELYFPEDKYGDEVAAALQVLQAHGLGKLDYEYSAPYEIKYFKPLEFATATVTPHQYPDEAEYMRNLANLKDYNSKKTENTRRKENYTKQTKNWSNFRTTYLDAWFEAKEKKEELNGISLLFEKYRTLTNGDVLSASKFLYERHGDNTLEEWERLTEPAHFTMRHNWPAEEALAEEFKAESAHADECETPQP